MKKIALLILIPTILIACSGGSGGATDEPDASGVVWLKRSTSGFEALVPGDFTVKQMQDTFGNYCSRNKKVTRSLRMVPEGNGQQRAIGACF